MRKIIIFKINCSKIKKLEDKFWKDKNIPKIKILKIKLFWDKNEKDNYFQDKLSKDKNFEDKTRCNQKKTFKNRFQKNHPVLEKFLSEMQYTFDGKSWNANGPVLVTNVMKHFCKVQNISQMNPENCQGTMS